MEEDSGPENWTSTISALDRSLFEVQKISPVDSAKRLRRALPDIMDKGHRLILVEIIKFDMVAAAEVGLIRKLEFYLDEFSPELPICEVPLDMVFEEWQIAKESDSEPTLDSYLQRFPHLADLLPGLVTSPENNLQLFGITALPCIPVGSRVAEFRILRQIGQGAFARVYLACQETLQRLVALKVSRRRSEEPQTLSRLDHKNIVRVYDERIHNDPPLNLLYMEFLGGGTLADCIKSVSSLPISSKRGQHILDSVASHLREYGMEDSIPANGTNLISSMEWPDVVARIGKQLADGLSYAHERQVVHCDIKPANTIFAADGTPKLADFNVSFSRDPDRSGAAAIFGGSLAYMSPEQLSVGNPEGGGLSVTDLDGRSDLFSLGVVLWELLYGTRPWQMNSMPLSWEQAFQIEISSRQQALEEHPQSTSFASSVGFHILDQAVRNCLATDPSDRPQSGSELASQLRLVHYPRAAKHLFPTVAIRPRWISRFSPWITFTIGALVPNVIAACFNYFYNSSEIVSKYPELWPRFVQISTWINCLFFPVGIALVFLLIARFRRGLKVETGPNQIEGDSPRWYWRLGHHVALICGGLWMIASLAYPVLIVLSDKSFGLYDAIHFFGSLTICGGIAIVYPFFAITYLSLKLYYPQSLGTNFLDPDFELWSARQRRLTRTYLLVAASVPLCALVFLASQSQVSQPLLLVAILMTAIGFAASFFVVQFADNYIHDVGDFMRENSEQNRYSGSPPDEMTRTIPKLG